jgi:hypothetical protein
LRAKLTESRWFLPFLAALILAVLGGSFVAGRALTSGERARAQVGNEDQQEPWFAEFLPEGALEASAPSSAISVTATPGNIATPTPNETPDFSEPGWYRKWLAQDETLPRANVVVNGIEVGPTVRRSNTLCDGDNRPVSINPEEAQSSRVAIRFGYMPEGSEVQFSDAIACQDQPAAYEVRVDLPALESQEFKRRLDAGESYFELPHGGGFSVYRMIGAPAFESGIPVERWSAGEIANLPAAIGRPILEDGFGNSAVIIHQGGVLTVVRGSHISLTELIRITEGLFQ